MFSETLSEKFPPPFRKNPKSRMAAKIVVRVNSEDVRNLEIIAKRYNIPISTAAYHCMRLTLAEQIKGGEA